MNKEKCRVKITKKGSVRILFNDSWRDVFLSDYENIELISYGANAVTVSGIHKITSRKDCIKIYTPNKSAHRTEVSTGQYLNEVRKLAALRDSHIVTVYNAFYENDIHIVTMEYIDGCTLEKWLNKRKAVKDECDYIERLEIAKTILEVVLSYQNQGIIHGDLHLNNILINNDKDIFIIDFGTSYFSNSNYSQKRESYFVYDLVRKILGEKFDENYFSLKCPKIISHKYYSNDVRSKYPILVTKTMLAYVKTMDLLLQICPSAVNRQDVVKLCVELTNGIYMDFDYICNSLWNFTEKKRQKSEIEHILALNIFNRIDPEVEDYRNYEIEKLQEDLIEIYYELSMETKAKWNVNKAKEYTFSYIDIIKDFEYDSMMSKFLETSASTYYDFIGGTDYESMTDNCMKQIMFDALSVYFGSLLFAQKIWEKLNERRWERIEEDYMK